MNEPTIMDLGISNPTGVHNRALVHPPTIGKPFFSTQTVLFIFFTMTGSQGQLSVDFSVTAFQLLL